MIFLTPRQCQKLDLITSQLNASRFVHAVISSVFNVITQKLESYEQQVIDVNGKYIIPLHVEDTSLAQIEIKKQHYLICMNDRRVTKLIRMQDALSADMHPLIVKKGEGYFSISYKQWYMRCDEQGNCIFDAETVAETEKFTVQ